MKAVFKSTGGGGGGTKEPSKDFTISYSAGEAIFHEGELGTEMFIIQEGDVNIIKRLRGEDHILSRLEKGDFFGEMSVLDTVPRSADAVAATDVRLVSINGARFDEMLRKNPEIAVRIIRKYSKRLREANVLLERYVGEDVHLAEKSVEPGEAPKKEPPHHHRVVDIATGNAFFFSKGDETLVGRSDPVTGILPDIDLTSVDTSRSVSRRHAKIIRNGEEYLVLEEVGTVNGTYVNEQRIPTGQPVPIRNGDRLKIGLIQMKVIFD